MHTDDPPLHTPSRTPTAFTLLYHTVLNNPLSTPSRLLPHHNVLKPPSARLGTRSPRTESFADRLLTMYHTVLNIHVVSSRFFPS
jgi:hypothetical protein